MSRNAIEYTVRQLFKIANPNGNLQYEIIISNELDKVTLVFRESKKEILFNLAKESDWYDLIKGNYNKLHWVKNAKDSYSIPILFWVCSKLPFITFDNDNRIVFNGDIISSAFFMLSRWEEKYNNNNDIHDRFKYENSVAFRYDFITIPIVDEYAMLLRKQLKMLIPDIDLGNSEFHIKLSHDIDNIMRFKSFNSTIRTIIGRDLIKYKNVSLFLKSLSEFKNSFLNPEGDPYFTAIYKLAKLSKEKNADSAFYFMTSDRSEFEQGYIIKDYVKKCIDYLQEQKFEVGFHPGYYTYKNYNKFIEEKERLDKILEYSAYGGRQHFLRFDINTTWSYWEKAGLKYDSSVGYAEHEGFRSGTCHPYKPFDIENDREMNIIEIPLIVMDVTLRSYRKLKVEDGLRSVLDLISKCKSVEGVFTLLWHNTSICNDWEEWVEGVYEKVLQL